MQFPHKTHVVGQGLECDACHVNIANSKSIDGGRDIPKVGVCTDCHEAIAEPSIVDFNFYQEKYKFNHKLHIAEKLECKECHEVMLTQNSFQHSQITPKMEFCNKCHDSKKAPQNCATCHTDSMRPTDHLVNWNKLHKVKANQNEAGCITCHESRNFCLDCHKGLEKPASTHNPNFELTHKFEARISTTSCNSCHKENFCSDCHKSSGISAESDIKIKSPHPQGWIQKTMSLDLDI